MNERIARIKELTSFFRSFIATKENPIPSEIKKTVKIAIIDDGLDPALHIVDGNHAKVFAGGSFCNSSPKFFTSSYYVPLGNHGTRVASIICQICPKVDLCIARLDEQNTRGGDRMINPLSAAKVIYTPLYTTKTRHD
jgi:hypothetical protein